MVYGKGGCLETAVNQIGGMLFFKYSYSVL